MIDNKEVHGTTEAKKASHFYIEIIEEEPLQFYILYRTKSMGTNLKVKVMQPYGAHHPLQLVLGADKSDIVYTLQNAQSEDIEVSTPQAWKNYSPFFIKRPESGLFGILKATRYVEMKESGVNSYQTATRNKRDAENSLMLFYVRKVIELPNESGAVPLSVGPVPDPTSECGDICLWMAPSDQEDTKSAFNELVGEDFVFP